MSIPRNHRNARSLSQSLALFSCVSLLVVTAGAAVAAPAADPIAVQQIASASLAQLTYPTAALTGSVQSGGTAGATPLSGVRVTLWEAGAQRPLEVSRTTTDSAGHFTLSVAPKRTTTRGIFVAQADLGQGVQLVTVVGPTISGDIVINELTTVAAAYSMAQFYRSGQIVGEPAALRIAAQMNDNLVAVATGSSSPVLLSSPNGDQSNSLRSTRALANLLAAAVADPAVARSLRELTTAPGRPAPRSTTEALANLARDPGRKVSEIYALTKVVENYLPALVRAPDAWTVTVKVNDSGDDSQLIGGVGNLVFDDRGNAWITNNVVQGTPYSSRALVVLQANGKPADGSTGTVPSPILGGGVLGAGFGIARSPKGSIWVGNFGWGPDTSCTYYPSAAPAPGCSGSLSQFTAAGVPVSGPSGIYGGPVNAQGMAFDKQGNLWIASYGNDSVYVFLKGDPTKVVSFQEYTGSQPFDLDVAPDGSVWVACGGGITGTYPSSVSRFRLEGNTIRRVAFASVGDAVKGLSIDSYGNAWVASQSDSTVYAVAPNGTVLGGFSGGGVNGPWSTSIDGEGNVWVADFGPLTFAVNETYSARLSKLAGANKATRPKGLKMGDPISPSTGYTVHSAGAQVLLHNGDPLYGPSAPPSFDPMQRTTAVGIDRAGNVWTLNNWKNDFGIDLAANPGGDGVVIFVGLAAPPATARN